MGFFDKIKAGLTKTREALSGTLGSVFSGFSEIDDDFYDELEESLILADLGVVMNANETELGGYKEITFSVSGEGAYSRLKYESGVHRVQRVPETESQGRVHTSTVTVDV